MLADESIDSLHSCGKSTHVRTDATRNLMSYPRIRMGLVENLHLTKLRPRMDWFAAGIKQYARQRCILHACWHQSVGRLASEIPKHNLPLNLRLFGVLHDLAFERIRMSGMGRLRGHKLSLEPIAVSQTALPYTSITYQHDLCASVCNRSSDALVEQDGKVQFPDMNDAIALRFWRACGPNRLWREVEDLDVDKA